MTATPNESKTELILEKSINNSDLQHDQNIISQKMIKYVEDKKILHNILLIFIDDSDNVENNFKCLIDTIDNQHEIEDHENFEHFLYLLATITNNYHRNDSFIKKIIRILQYYQDKIKSSFSNSDIFNIFQDCKVVLLFLFENNIIEIDESIYIYLMDKYDKNGSKYCHFFYLEIKKYIGEQKSKRIEEELKSINQNILSSFNEKRHEGVNDSYICSLIRNDSVEEFIAYVNRMCIFLNSKIETSIFETSTFLIENKPTLIEYSAFYGSIQIFQYLLFNNVELTPKLWLYAIHSQNAELIHILEYNEVEPPSNDYVECFKESIKCHHNDIADYIQDTLMQIYYDNSEKREEIISTILQYHNYKYFPKEFMHGYELFYLCSINYHTLAKLFIVKNKKDIEIKANEILLKEASNKNKVEIMYYLLSKQTKIEKGTFENCKLKQIAIPSSITSFGIMAFYYCEQLTQITIPRSVTLIDNSAFENCEKLEQIKIPSSITSIGWDAFKFCYKLEKITIPSSVTSIGGFAFYSCCSLKEVILSTSLSFINYATFKRCYSLTHITIPSSVKGIGSYAFNYCQKLENVFIPSSVTSIGFAAFNGCCSLKISIPSSVKNYGSLVFDQCISVTINMNQTSEKTSYYKVLIGAKSVQIIGYIINLPNYLFSECSILTQITIPSSVTSIGDWSFNKCSSITKIEIPSSVTKIGHYAFSECSKLTTIIIPSLVTSIGDFAFYKCSNLMHITIPLSVTFIGDYAFCRCSSLTNFTVPSITSIRRNTFCKCYSLEKITIPPSVTSIECDAFEGCTSLKQITILSSVTFIEKDSFRGCPSAPFIQLNK